MPATLRTVARMWQRIYFPTREQLDELAARRAYLLQNAVESTPVAAV